MEVVLLLASRRGNFNNEKMEQKSKRISIVLHAKNRTLKNDYILNSYTIKKEIIKPDISYFVLSMS